MPEAGFQCGDRAIWQRSNGLAIDENLLEMRHDKCGLGLWILVKS